MAESGLMNWREVIAAFAIAVPIICICEISMQSLERRKRLVAATEERILDELDRMQATKKIPICGECDGWGREFRYELKASGRRAGEITSAGPDGHFETADDISFARLLEFRVPDTAANVPLCCPTSGAARVPMR